MGLDLRKMLDVGNKGKCILSVKTCAPSKIMYIYILYHETKFVSKKIFTFRTILRTVSMLTKLKRHASLSIMTDLANNYDVSGGGD